MHPKNTTYVHMHLVKTDLSSSPVLSGHTGALAWLGRGCRCPFGVAGWLGTDRAPAEGEGAAWNNKTRFAASFHLPGLPSALSGSVVSSYGTPSVLPSFSLPFPKDLPSSISQPQEEQSCSSVYPIEVFAVIGSNSEPMWAVRTPQVCLAMEEPCAGQLETKAASSGA